MKEILSESSRYVARQRRWNGEIEVLELASGKQIRRYKSIVPREIPVRLSAGEFLSDLELSFLLLNVWRANVDKPTVHEALLSLRWLVITLFIINQVAEHERPVSVVEGQEYEINYFDLNKGIEIFIDGQAIEERNAVFGGLQTAGWLSGMIEPGYFLGEPGKNITEPGLAILSGMVKQFHLMRGNDNA